MPPLCPADFATAQNSVSRDRLSYDVEIVLVWLGRAFKRAEKNKKWATNIHRRTSIHIDCTYMSHPGTGNRVMKISREIVGSKHSKRQSKTERVTKKVVSRVQ
jgi:hypothetical protein